MTQVYKTASISAAVTNNTIVAAVTGKKIAVHGYVVVHTKGNVGEFGATVLWQDGTGGTNLTGQMSLSGALMTLVVPFSPIPWFTTSTNTLLNLAIGSSSGGGSAALCRGHVIYSEVD